MTLAFLAVLLSSNSFGQEELNTIERAMKDELSRSMSELKSDNYDDPFFIRYRIRDNDDIQIFATLGSIQQSLKQPYRTKEVRVMVGDYDFNDESLDDNSLENGPPSFGYMDFSVPLGDDYYGIRRSLWITTDAIYKQAGKIYKDHLQRLVEEGKSAEEMDHRSFAKVEKSEYVEPIQKRSFTVSELEDFAKRASAFFLDYDQLFASSVRVSSSINTVYMMNSEGTRYRACTQTTALTLSAALSSENKGLSYERYTYQLLPGQQLPSLEEVKVKIAGLISQMKMKDRAQSFEDSYYGPVLFRGSKVPELFNDYLINQLYASTELGQADYYGYGFTGLEEKINKRIISKTLSVQLHTRMEEWNGVPLRGSYKMDEEGVMAPDTLLLVENGFLRNLMSTRTLLREGQMANGTGSGPGVVMISAKKTLSEDELKARLIEIARENEQEYAVIITGKLGSERYEVDILKVDVITGQETLMTGASLAKFEYNDLIRVAGVSTGQSLTELDGASYIAPDAILIEDIGIRKAYNRMKMKEPVVESPLKKAE